MTEVTVYQSIIRGMDDDQFLGYVAKIQKAYRVNAYTAVDKDMYDCVSEYLNRWPDTLDGEVYGCQPPYFEVICNPCNVCGQQACLRLSIDEQRKLDQGYYVQTALSRRSADFREMILTGTHPECWKVLYHYEEEEDRGYDLIADPYDWDV